MGEKKIGVAIKKNAYKKKRRVKPYEKTLLPHLRKNMLIMSERHKMTGRGGEKTEQKSLGKNGSSPEGAGEGRSSRKERNAETGKGGDSKQRLGKGSLNASED